MTRESTFLERLAFGERSEDRSVKQNAGRLEQSVLRNVSFLLNTRQGDAVTAPDFGVPAITELARSYPVGIDDLRRAIQETIQKYEPRLKEVYVEQAQGSGDEFHLHFQVSARLAGLDEVWPIRFRTTFDPSGKAKVD